VPMSPFEQDRRVVPAAARCCPARRCAVCRRRLGQLRQEFAAMVSRCWSPAEIDLLGKAARSALL
jgi:hypothetical protein